MMEDVSTLADQDVKDKKRYGCICSTQNHNINVTVVKVNHA